MTRGAVIVTGASSGIGRATALLLARQGWFVFGSVRSAADAEKLATRAGAVGVGALVEALQLDVTDTTSVAHAVALVRARLEARGERLVGLVNNAGIVVAGPVEEVPLDRLRAVLEVNVVGAVAVTQAFLPLLRAGRGRIVNVSSVSGRVATPFLGPYSASKFALEALSDALRAELRPAGIAVILVEPGPVVTPIWKKGEAATLADRASIAPGSPYASIVPSLIAAFRRSGRGGLAAERVAEVIATALREPRPRARYPVTRRAMAFTLLARFAPDSLRDRLLAWRGRG